MVYLFFFFFFQAEDGIRDYKVTGVQTCALPIFDVNSWGRSACYPRRTFYPLSDGPSTQNHRITKPDFRPCLTRQSRSQAPFCLCALRLITDQPEGTFGRLRYLLGGDRPSQTTHQTLSLASIRSRG